MVAFSFSKQFADDVESGRKLQTIREKARAKAGDKLQLYTGMRTRCCRKLRDAICIGVSSVLITQDGPIFAERGWFPKDKDAFARRDGFKDYASMYGFFHKEYNVSAFSGFIIMWSVLPEYKGGQS